MDHCVPQLWFFSRFSISMRARNKHKLSPHWKWKREPVPETQDGWVVFFWAESQIQLREKTLFFFRQMTRLGTKCANAVLTDLLCVILWACVCATRRMCFRWWLELSAITAANSQRVTLTFRALVCSKQSSVFAARTLRAACKTGAKERGRKNASADFHLRESHMPSLSIELQGELWPDACSL